MSARRPASRRAAARARGVAALEFAIAAPLLVFLIFAVAEFGRAFVQYTTLANSVREATVYVARNAILGSTGIVNLTAPPYLGTQGKKLVVYGNVDPAADAKPILPGMTIGTVDVTAVVGTDIQVTADYAYSPLIGRLGLGIEVTGFTMRASNRMRAL